MRNTYSPPSSSLFTAWPGVDKYILGSIILPDSISKEPNMLMAVGTFNEYMNPDGIIYNNIYHILLINRNMYLQPITIGANDTITDILLKNDKGDYSIIIVGRFTRVFDSFDESNNPIYVDSWRVAEFKWDAEVETYSLSRTLTQDRGANGEINAAALDYMNNLHLVGEFTKFAGVSCNRYIMLDKYYGVVAGSGDAWNYKYDVVARKTLAVSKDSLGNVQIFTDTFQMNSYWRYNYGIFERVDLLIDEHPGMAISRVLKSKNSNYVIFAMSIAKYYSPGYAEGQCSLSIYQEGFEYFEDISHNLTKTPYYHDTIYGTIIGNKLFIQYVYYIDGISGGIAFATCNIVGNSVYKKYENDDFPDNDDNVTFGINRVRVAESINEDYYYLCGIWAGYHGGLRIMNFENSKLYPDVKLQV